MKSPSQLHSKVWFSSTSGWCGKNCHNLKRKIGDASWGEGNLSDHFFTSKLEEGPIRATAEMWDWLCLRELSAMIWGGITWLKWWKDLPTCIGYINSHFIFNPQMSGFLKIAVLKLLGFEPESTETMPGLAFCICKCTQLFHDPTIPCSKRPFGHFDGYWDDCSLRGESCGFQFFAQFFEIRILWFLGTISVTYGLRRKNLRQTKGLPGFPPKFSGLKIEELKFVIGFPFKQSPEVSWLFWRFTTSWLYENYCQHTQHL